ncbi:MAG: DUF3459 domain-containing protein [Spirochaetales bacterium]|nr:DUF3459 domain-containing protein [Spirochaetales bacterium]
MKKFLLLAAAAFLITACSSAPQAQSAARPVSEAPVKPLGVSPDSGRWWQAATGPAYQVLVYSFADSNGDGWGDLKGLTEHLDYLNDGKGAQGKSLNVSAIWLSPIFPADSYHGYDVDNYFAIDKKWGTMQDFENLVAAAHKRGIKILLDMPFNHTGRGNPWFQSFANDPKSPYADWYIRKNPKVTYGYGEGGWNTTYDENGDPVTYYSSFWAGMPDLNASNPAVVQEYHKILKFWLDRGVDGFRFDAAKFIFNSGKEPRGTPTVKMNNAFWSSLRTYARTIKPDVFFLAEIYSWSVPELAAYAGSFDSDFDFADSHTMDNIVGGGGLSGLDSMETSSLAQFARYPEFTPSTFLSNHDQDRIMSQLLVLTGQDPVYSLMYNKFLAAIDQTLPGLPWVYYGEELGMLGARYMNDDVARRDDFPWTEDRGSPPNCTWAINNGHDLVDQNDNTASVALQTKDPKSLLNFYRSLADLRSVSPAIQGGTYKSITWDGFSNNVLYSYERVAAQQTVLVVHNMGTKPVRLSPPANLKFTPLWDSQAGLLSGQKSLERHLEVPAATSSIWIVTK